MTRISEDRITRHAAEDPRALKANERNWRRHGQVQRKAMRSALDDVGWVQRVIVNETTGNIIDGHLRVELAIEEGLATVPVVYVALSDEEERLVLATFDSIGRAADVDATALRGLLDGIEVDFSSLTAARPMFDDLAPPTRAPQPSVAYPDAYETKPSETALHAPFVYHGGKRRWADRIWLRLGWEDDAPHTYVEPFAGSLAVLLASPPHAKEIVNDTSGHVVNFWRAVAADPDAVALHLDWPSYHDDLIARNAWLVRWRDANAERLRTDAEFHDAKAAGWWAWGVANHIRGDYAERATDNRVPSAGSRSVQAGSPQSMQIAHPRTAQASHPQTMRLGPGSRAAQADSPKGAGVEIGTGDRFRDWMRDLQRRLSRVIVLNTDWRNAITDSALAQTESVSSKPVVAVLLDPPYLTEGASKVYGSDHAGTSDATADAAYEWAVEHGERYRIAYCQAAGDHPVPAGWVAEERPFHTGGQGRLEQVLFSPQCLWLDAPADQPT